MFEYQNYILCALLFSGWPKMVILWGPKFEVLHRLREGTFTGNAQDVNHVFVNHTYDIMYISRDMYL